MNLRMLKTMWPFRKKTELNIPSSRTEYPRGLFICTESGFFLIREKSRLRVPSQRVMISWSAPLVPSSEAAVKHLPILGKIGFRDGSLVRNFSDQRLYLISDNKKRLIESPDFIDRMCLNKELIIVASQGEVNLHEDGEVLN
jgi:hypothetical protein